MPKRTVSSNRLVRFLALGSARRLLLLEAAARLVVARLTTLLVPFRLLGPRLRAINARRRDPGATGQQLEDIVWAVGAAGRHLPWQCSCLVRAIAAKRMLGRRGITSTLTLGLAREEGSKLKAHAWLAVAGEVLPGWEMEEGFTPVATYSDEPETGGTR